MRPPGPTVARCLAAREPHSLAIHIGLRIKQVHPTVGELKAQQVAGLEEADAATSQGLWRHVADGGTVGHPRVAPVADQCGQLAQRPVGVDVLHRREHLGHAKGPRTLTADDHGQFKHALLGQPIKDRLAVQRLQAFQRWVPLATIVRRQGQQLLPRPCNSTIAASARSSGFPIISTGCPW
jgi:hypothetical protein